MSIPNPASVTILIMVYAAQPREGTETRPSPRWSWDSPSPWFMQLNPARGRKLTIKAIWCSEESTLGLCSSTPRGDGNLANIRHNNIHCRWVYAAQPREGTETRDPSELTLVDACMVYAAQPREGTETTDQ
mgnify:CR=1 FL=1